MTKKLIVADHRVRLQIWDTAGAERFRSMAPMYYRSANAVIVVYDITSEESFDAIATWVEEVRKHTTDDLSKDFQWKRYIKHKNDQGYDTTIIVGVEEVFLHMTRKLVERKNEIERISILKADNAITLQQLEDERKASVCCGI
ncbi:hypothetical protein BGZ93_000434 [Podila epicladia]|nr:hypothetical protein BGZ93_000434 [Podila epicladia]